MKTITIAQFHGNIDNFLQEVLDTGIPLEISKGDQKLRIVPAAPVDKFTNLVHRPDVINGDSSELPYLQSDKDFQSCLIS